jgi:membrane protein implicated in regulation of membrane protease activity
MNTRYVNPDPQTSLLHFLDSVIMGLVGTFVFITGMLFSMIFLLVAVIFSPIALIKLWALRRKFEQALRQSHFVNTSSQDDSVIDGKYTVIDR